MKRGNSDIGRRFRQYKTNQRLYENPVRKSEHSALVNLKNSTPMPIFLRNENSGISKSKMAMERMKTGMTALVFARKLNELGFPTLTESKIYRIETGRAIPTDQERDAIVKLLGPGIFEICRNHLGKLEYKIISANKEIKTVDFRGIANAMVEQWG